MKTVPVMRLLPALLLGLSVSATQASVALVSSDAEGVALNSRACAYGRGSTVLRELKTQLRQQIQGHFSARGINILTHIDAEPTLIDGWLRQLRDGDYPVDFSAPQIEGSDTCLTAELQLSATASSSNDEELGWSTETSSDPVVLVVAEGWPDAILKQTAVQAAENQGLHSAVSKALVELIDAISAEVTSEPRPSPQLLRSVLQQAIDQDAGLFVKDWIELESKPLANNGVQMTLEVTVSSDEARRQVSDISQMMGNPQIFVQSPDRQTTDALREVLGALNMQLTQRIDDAQLVLRIESSLVTQDNSSQLKLSIYLDDLWGNLYGSWQNSPSLLSLPTSQDVASQLLDVHLSLESTTQELAELIRSSMTKVFEQGGPLREITFQGSGPANLVLSDVPGLSAVDTVNNEGNPVFKVRFLGSTLALTDRLQHHANNEGIKLSEVFAASNNRVLLK